MTLDGAINLNETNEYTIYTMNSVATGQYGVVVPKNVNVALNMLVDLHMKSSFDGVGSGTKTREQLVAEINDEYGKLKGKYAEGMLVMPMINEVEFQTIVSNGDKQKMFDEVKKIGAITSELYKKLTDSGIDKQKIDQKIIIVQKTSEDEKFVSWLKEQMPNFVDGVLYSELSSPQATNPFVSNDSIFGPTPVEPKVEETVSATEPVVPVAEPTVTETVNVGNIFDNVAPAVSAVEPVVSTAPVESVVTPAAPVAPVVEPVVATPVVPAVNEPVNNSVPQVDLFGNATSQSITNNEVVSAPVAPVVNDTVVQQPTPVEGPKPVESSMLEGTIAFTPIPNHPNNPVENLENGENTTPEGKGSKGFVNLAILLVVLVGVTLVSIELGKYLYNVYGA